MREVKLTINGNRDIPISLGENTIKQLANTNNELSFLIGVSPDKVEHVLSHNGDGNELVFKVKLLTIEPVGDEI